MKSYEMDMCNGPLLKKILVFAIPLMLSGVLQLLFNAADMVIAGKYIGSDALAAVGATGALINLLINVFIGLSVGSSVLVARYYGAKQFNDIRETIHTAISLSLICSLILVGVGIALAKPLLTLMGTPDDVLNEAALYIQVYFAGMPVILFYNFGSGILRAVGDTRRPLYFLTIAGVLNVGMNILFVKVFGMGVEGVALATVLSQCISAGLILACLLRSEGACRLELKKLHIYKDKLIGILKIGLPAGFQGAIFSISNVLIQSSVNSFDSLAMAGNTAASNLEGFMNTAMNCFHQAAVSFTSQNIGARKYKRVNRILIICLSLVTILGITMGSLALIFGRQLLGLYADEAIVVEFGMIRAKTLFMYYFLCGTMDLMVGSIRGMGYSVMPMITSLLGACVFRIIWIFTVFKFNHTLPTLYLSYPVSWGLTTAAHMVCYIFGYRRLLRRSKKQ